MSLYIAFNNFSSFLEISERVDSTEDIEAAVADLIEKVGHDTFAGGHTIILTESELDTLPEVDGSLENLVSAIDCGETAAVDQISPVVLEPKTEKSEIAAKKQNSKIEAENVVQNEIYKEFYSLLKKFEVSLQYRYDFTDIFDGNRETEQSQHFNKLIEKNLNQQRARQQEDFEKRFQEKQAENFREYLKQKERST